MTLRALAGRLVPVAAVLVLGLVHTGPAAAHTRLIATSPADGARVPATTDQLVLSFTQPVRADLARVQVTGPDGAVRPGTTGGSGADVVQQLQAPLSAGAWTAAYRVLSPDGHPVSGALTFTVAPPPPSAVPSTAPATGPAAPAASAPAPSAPASTPVAEPSTEPAADARGAAGNDPSALSVALGGLVLGAVGASVVVLRRRRSSSTRAAP